MTEAEALALLAHALILLALSVLAVGLTMTMFHAREMMLGFPSVLFWAILGGYAYTQSATPWRDWWFFLFFASTFGMTTFCMLAMYGLRRSDLAQPHDNEPFFDEGGQGGSQRSRKQRGSTATLAEGVGEDEVAPSRSLAQGVRERAQRRRAARGADWGEFS